MWLTFEDVKTFLVFSGLCYGAYIYIYVYKRRKHASDDGRSLPPTLTVLPVIGSLPFLPLPHKMHIWFMERIPTMGAVVGFYARSKQVKLASFY
jgi:hypothetical protein